MFVLDLNTISQDIERYSPLKQLFEHYSRSFQQNKCLQSASRDCVFKFSPLLSSHVSVNDNFGTLAVVFIFDALNTCLY